MTQIQAIICPWCGTYYQVFQSNCSNCGGPIQPLEAVLDQVDSYITPPPAPRPVPNSYFWKLLLNDGWGIGLLVFLFLGIIFSFLGVILTLAVVTMFVGLPFLGIGLIFFFIGLIGLILRGQEMHNIVVVLQQGLPVRGEILNVEENVMVTVNNRHPWKISYRFILNGAQCQGELTTINLPSEHHQPGKPVCVLYLPGKPEINTIYPHP